MRLLAAIGIWLIVQCPGSGEEERDPLAALVSKLSANQFAQREEAVQQLAALADTRAEDVFTAVMAVVRGDDPEAKVRAQSVVRRVFERQVLGVGSPQLGVTWTHYMWLKDDLAQTAAMVEQVVEGSPAQVAGLQFGDVVSKVDGEVVEGADSLERVRRIIAARNPREVVAFEMRRFKKHEYPGRVGFKGPLSTIKVTLGPRREEPARVEGAREYREWLEEVEARYGKSD